MLVRRRCALGPKVVGPGARLVSLPLVPEISTVTLTGESPGS